MSSNVPCPECQCEYTYDDGYNQICTACSHEWNQTDVLATQASYQDAFGSPLVDGDSVTLIKNLKVKSTSTTLKTGTKVKNIRLVQGDHDIDCKVEGIGPMKLKTQFVKKCT